MQTSAAFLMILAGTLGYTLDVSAAQGNPVDQPAQTISPVSASTDRQTSVRVVSKILPGLYARQCGDDPAPIVVSPDGLHVAYVAGLGKEKYIDCADAGNWGSDGWLQHFPIVDGKKWEHQAPYVQFSADSKHAIYWNPKDRIQLVDDRPVDDNQVKFIAPEEEAKPSESKYTSPDGKQVAYIVQGTPGGETFVVVNEKEGKHYSAKTTLLGNLKFRADGKLAYTVQTYTNQSGGTLTLVVAADDGKEVAADNWGAFVSPLRLYPLPFTYSPDGQSGAFVTWMDSTYKKRQVIVNGKAGKPYDEVRSLVFSPDGKSLAYAANSKNDHGWRIVVNGREGKVYDFVLTQQIVEGWHFNTPPIFGAVNRSSLHFDSPNTLHYLAVSGKDIVLVEERLNEPGGKPACQSVKDRQRTS